MQFRFWVDTTETARVWLEFQTHWLVGPSSLLFFTFVALATRVLSRGIRDKGNKCRDEAILFEKTSVSIHVLRIRIHTYRSYLDMQSENFTAFRDKR